MEVTVEKTREQCIFGIADDLTTTVNKTTLTAALHESHITPKQYRIYLKTYRCSNSWLAPEIQELRKETNRLMVEGYIELMKEKEATCH